MEKTFFFIVILGETDNKKMAEEQKRLEALGEVVELTERTYGLVIKSEEEPDRKEIRRKISGDEKLITIIVQIKPRTGLSWCLRKTKSIFLTEIYQTLIKETENEQ